MNRLRNIVGLIAVCATAAFFTGCGNDDDNNGNQSNAPASLAGRTYNLTDAAGTSTIAFDQNGTAYALTPSGTNNAVETGSFTATQNGETWNSILTNSGGDRTSMLDLTFTGDGVGTYVFTAPGEAPVSGSFAAAGTATDGNTTTTATDGNTTTTATDGNTTTGQGTVNAPTTLQTITITPVNGIAPNQAFAVNLTGGNFTTARVSDGQDMGSGTYQYTPNGTTANLRLLYGGTNNGDIDDYNLVFTQQQGSGQANNFTGTQTVSGQATPINGTFMY